MTSLGGADWQLRGFLGEEWRWHLAKPWDAPGWLPARVPGSVLDDLVRAGEAASPYRMRDSRLSEWVPQRAWVYRRRLASAAAARVRFEGVDHEATVFVDGEEVGRHEGAFTPFEVPVPAGDHLLEVVLHPAPESEPQVGRTSRVRVHKSRMGYGWDFCPRLVHLGIWRPVTLDPPPALRPLVRLEDGAGTVEADGEVLLRVEEPELWWPNGFGAQRLYAVPELGISVGFRTVELDGYRLVVNGRTVPVKGWNWVPLDALYGVPRPEKLAHLLGLAAGANVTLLRVWGGGLIETEEFYEACDRLGLLVWQEFVQSSSGLEDVPSAEPEFVERLRADAREIVPRLRRHPSLAVWCGGNELDADDSAPALAALREVVRELDPGRAWLVTSPAGEADVHGPWEHQGLRAHNGYYDSRTSRLHSEFGVEGMTNRRVLAATVDEEHRLPADRTNPVYAHLGAWWNNAPLVQEAFGGGLGDLETLRRASQWLQYEGLRYAVEATLRRGAGTIPWQFGEPFPNAWCTCAVDYRGDPKPAYWGLARAYAAGAASARFETSAWGGLGTAKATASGPARFLDLDGTVVAETAGGELVAPLAAFAGDVFLLDVGPDAVPAGQGTVPGTVPPPGPRGRGTVPGTVPAPAADPAPRRNRYVMTRTKNLAPLLDLPAATLVVERCEGPSNSLLLGLRNASPVAALGVVLEDARPYEEPGWVTFSDNVLDLLPGEERTLEVRGPAGELRIEGWNARG